MKIKKIKAREILDSRGNPTVSVRVVLENGVEGEASVPSGASTGIHEALELRDGGKRYGGKGVLRAVENVNSLIVKRLKGLKVVEQEKIDKLMIELDGTKNKSRLGANAILGVSLACARAAAQALSLPLYKYLRQTYKLTNLQTYKLPYPMMNVINGGRHANNTISTQEFMIIPKVREFKERVRIGAEIFHVLKDVLKSYRQATTVGDEGGFAPNIEGPFGYAPNFDEDEIGLELIVRAIKKAGYQPGRQVFIGLDIAASELYQKDKGYDFDFKQKNRGKKFKKYPEILKMYQAWLKKYPIISLEDPFAEDDWVSWQNFNLKLKTYNLKTLLVGDDLFVTNVERLKKGIKEGVANAILIKLNQIGTLSETIETIKLAQENNYKVIISHRSGETADTFIADLAVAVNADYIKAGSLSRSERVEKYNRLMAIEDELNG